MDIKEKIKDLPNAPGVYLMKDESGSVIYVGKAEDLKKRVSSYFYPNTKLSNKIEAMVSRVRDIDYMPTSTSAEALIYENSLIKKYDPRYNTALRDDKSYPMLKLTVNEDFPRLIMTRRKKDDGAVYYGPYSSAGLLKEALGIMRRLFPLRTCGRFGRNLCLSFHIGQCLGPCVNRIDKEKYKALVDEVRLFLDGKKTELIELLSARMKERAKAQDFEEAEGLRRKIEALSAIKDKRVLYSAAGDLEELSLVLGMAKAPQAIEAFDVSNIMGKFAVGSMIYFYKGKPKKSAYKRFRIKTVGLIDDYAMIREIVRRRYTRVLKEKRNLPDLILIDGGKGHLESALEELDKLDIHVPVVSIAKEFERLYAKNKPFIILPQDSKALNLLKRIRDEAHRFAIAYHKSLRRKGAVHSELDGIDGIGPKRKRGLILYFGSVDNIKKAPEEELLKIKGMNEKAARSIIEYFK
ncbi:MAG: hypothetical protein AUJ75_03015 [Candidatus Omnitrophica bacterium CG1_02_49_10]|nr:MAG: hypothetical protein AUJ75_03015 [Candidatus Omnitrophica bacterium CG1_02_49_10]